MRLKTSRLLFALMLGMLFVLGATAHSTRAQVTATPTAAKTSIFDAPGFSGGQVNMTMVTPKTGPPYTTIQLEKNLLEKKGRYRFRVLILPDPSPKLDAFNDAVTTFVVDEIAKFQEIIADLKPDPSFGDSDLNIDFELKTWSDDALSVIFRTGFYAAGAAHPTSSSHTINFSQKTGKLLELADLFKSGANYLKVIAEYATADLKKRAFLDFPEGALPEAQNYQRWNITDKGLLITFDVYQVAPYAVGPLEVTMPYNALKNIIDPGGVLGVYVK